MLLKAASMVRSAILGSPKLDGLTPEKLRLMKTFFEDPISLMQDPVDYYDQKAQAKASYSPQSATVMGILKDMYDTFAADLEKSNQDVERVLLLLLRFVHELGRRQLLLDLITLA